MKNLLDLKTFFKFLSRNKAYTAIDLFGLSVSLTFVILIAIYSAQEFSTDRFQEKGERVYFVGSEGVPCVGAAIPYMMKERYPEIEKVCPLVMDQFNSTKVESEGKIILKTIPLSPDAEKESSDGEGNAENSSCHRNCIGQKFERYFFGIRIDLKSDITEGPIGAS